MSVSSSKILNLVFFATSKKKALIGLLFCVFCLSVSAQTLEWQKEPQSIQLWSQTTLRPVLALALPQTTAAQPGFPEWLVQLLSPGQHIEQLSRLIYPVLLSPSDFDRFRIRGFPTLLILDSTGVERIRWEGPVSAHDFWAAISALTGVDVSPTPEKLPLALVSEQVKFVPLGLGLWQLSDHGLPSLYRQKEKTGALILLQGLENGLTFAIPPAGGQAFVYCPGSGLWLESYWLTKASNVLP